MATTATKAITTTAVSKNFAGVNALSNVSIDVDFGEIYGLIGPDGAGKTTLFRILTTLLLPASGHAEVCGFDVASNYFNIRSITGYMPGRFSLYPDLSVEENLKFYAALFGVGIDENFAMIEPIYAQLAPFSDRRAGKLSGGMKQKLALCCALIHKPRVLFLDEPTTGVDAVSRSEFWDILSEIKLTGMPILVSTPYMDEASRCDRISLIDSGRILETGTLDDILERNRMPLLSISSRNNYRTLQRLRTINGISGAYLFGEQIHAFVDPLFDPGQLLTIDGIDSAVPIRPDIEDVFIKIMGNANR